MHITILCVAALFGAALGLRFKVFVLFPATALVVGIMAAVDLASGAGTWTAGFCVVFAAVALQIGYLVSSAVSGIVRERHQFPFRPMASRFPRR